ncbi:MAG: glycosyltransferase [Flavobacteriaceae bacterium]|nr:glycosyltransferase [Flavobacteriaceae bacterium]
MNKLPLVTMAFGIKRTFIKRDVALLSSMECRLQLIQANPRKDWLRFLFNKTRELFMCLWFVPQSKWVISWFNDYHCFFLILFAKIFKVKSLIIVGGYDAVCNTTIDYGLFSKANLRQQIARWNYNHCSEIWVVHQSLAYGCPISNQQKHITSGIKTFLPDLRTPIVEVPTVYDSTFWKSSGEEKDSIVLTVGIINDKRTYDVKGIDVFLELAKKMESYQFIIVGISQQLIHLLTPHQLKNLEFHPTCTQDKLRKFYQKSQFYFQGSTHEGHPNVLCEAMLCECIPIGRRVFGIPDIIGSTGYLFDCSKHLEPMMAFIHSADSSLGIQSRNRIMNQYPITKRVDAFHAFFQSSNN